MSERQIWQVLAVPRLDYADMVSVDRIYRAVAKSTSTLFINYPDPIGVLLFVSATTVHADRQSAPVTLKVGNIVLRICGQHTPELGISR